MIKQLLSRLFPPHAWQEEDERRTCTVCDRREELDLGGGHSGSLWVVEEKGDPSKHNKETK